MVSLTDRPSTGCQTFSGSQRPQLDSAKVYGNLAFLKKRAVVDDGTLSRSKLSSASAGISHFGAAPLDTPHPMIGPPDEVAPARPSEIKFHYIKSPIYRTVHADGVFGGITPSGLIEMTLFSERFPIPTSARHPISADGAVQPEIERTSRDGIVRELEAGAVMTLETAKLIRDWFVEQVAQLEKARSRVGA